MSFCINYRFNIYNRFDWSRRIKEWRSRLQREKLRKSKEEKEYKKRDKERVKKKKNIKKGIKRVYKESDCASLGNEALRKLQVIDTFLPAAINCVTYLFSLFTLILIVVVYW